MTTELTYLGWTMVLALVQIGIATSLRVLETGLPWASSPRDKASSQPIGKLTGRLLRAQYNLLETLPIFIAAVLILQAVGIHNTTTVNGVILYFWARVAYVPIYALGIRYVRTLVWTASIVGIVMLLIAALHPV